MLNREITPCRLFHQAQCPEISRVTNLNRFEKNTYVRIDVNVLVRVDGDEN